jgi:hypothetical protein
LLYRKPPLLKYGSIKEEDMDRVPDTLRKEDIDPNSVA